MNYEGHIMNGMVILDQPVSLPDGTKVRIEPLLSLNTGFWQACSLEELAQRQGVPPLTTGEEILGQWPQDELNDGFEDAVHQWRQSEMEKIRE
jgi:hypothetical protein